MMATEPGDELEAKRAATMDSLAAGVDADSTHKKKQQVQEGDDGYSSSDDSLASFGSLGSDSEWRAYNWPRKESEWDKDSYDDYEFKINPRIRRLYPSDETFEDYCKDRRKAFDSKGFLPDHRCGIYSVLLDSEPPPDKKKVDKTAGEMMADLAKLCVEKFNETEKKTLEFVNVVRATENIGPECKYYITFLAREHPNGPLVECQAKVIKYLGGDKPPFPILCRPSPQPEI